MASTAGPGDGLAAGTLLVMGAEALAFPAGLVVTILLTRHLGPQQYGTLALALTAIAWLEWTVVSLFSRAAYKLVAEADDWRPAAEAVVRTFLLASLAAAVVVFALAGVAGRVFGAPDLTLLLRILAVEIPIFVAAQAYRSVLVGRGLHGSRAAVAALRWTVRAVLVAGGVLAGVPMSVIVMLIVAATAVELWIARRLALVGRGSDEAGGRTSSEHLTMRRLLSYAAPLAVSAICLRLFERLDIFALRLLGGTMESVAAYGVAQNLALMPGLFGGAFVPALIAGLSSRLAGGDADSARQLGGQALRAAFLFLPLVLIAAGAAPALIDLLFGPSWAAAAPLFAVLVAGAAGTLVMGLCGGMLIAAGRFRWTIALAAPLLLIALAGHLLVVPRAGAIGAAAVTSGTALLGAAASCAAVWRLLAHPVPLASLGRALVFGGAAGWAARSLPAMGMALPFVLVLLIGAVAIALWLTGEVRPEERVRARLWAQSLSFGKSRE